MKRFNYDIKHSVYGVRSKSIFNSDFINDRVKRFFRNTEFKSQFVSIILKFTAENGTIWRTLGTRTIIDLTKKEDINNYVLQLIAYCNELSDWYDNISPEQIIFEYINVSELDYKRDLNRKIRSSIPLLPIQINKIRGFSNIPFNNNYLSWGENSEVIDSTTTIIRDVIIDKNISEITVNKENQFTTHITLNYIYNKSDYFSDFNKNDYIRRTFSNGKIVFFDNSETPYFYYEDFNSNDNMVKIKPSSKHEFEV